MSEIIHKQLIKSASDTKRNQIFMALIFGLSILSVVSLAPMEVIHNATHDVRHSSGFPCH